MATRNYKLYWASGTSADNKASLRVVAKGLITAISWSISGLSGADVTGRLQVELSKTAVNQITINDTPPNGILSEVCVPVGGAVASESFGLNFLVAGIGYPVDVLDTLYIHQIFTGAAAISSLGAQCVVTVTY